MRIVLGIGNPGKRYESTRHNIGFLILNNFAEKNKLTFVPSKSDYYYAEGVSGDSQYILVKPSTYVNNSGLAAVHAINNYNSGIKDFLVIVDDVNINIGTIRVRASGGDGGHNGMKSIIYHTGSDEFPRIRIGIGSEFTEGSMADYVLSKFHKTEIKIIEDSVNITQKLMEEFISGGTKQMLDFYSKFKKPKLPPEI